MPMATNMWLPHPRAFGCDGSTPGGVQPGTGLKPPDVVCWDAEVVGMCDRKDLEALSPLRHFGNGNRKRNGKETGLAPSHTILHVKFTVYDYTHRYIHIYIYWMFARPTVRETVSKTDKTFLHCFENCLKLLENCLKIVFLKNNFMKIVWTCFLFKICSDQFYENCLNIVFFIKKSLKTILWKLFKHSFYQQDLWNNFMNIV